MKFAALATSLSLACITCYGAETSDCATTVSLLNAPQDLSRSARIAVEPGKSVCWEVTTTQKVVVSDSEHYVVHLIQGGKEGDKPRAAVLGQDGYAAMVHVEDVKDGSRVTFFILTTSAQSHR